MNKILALLVLGISIALTGNSLAKHMKGGFSDPNISASSVKDALNMGDGTPVTLKGKIEKSLGDEKYQFNDGSGIIVIEIDDDEWNGLAVTPDMMILISGEIDKNLMSTPEVDVDRIVVIQ